MESSANNGLQNKSKKNLNETSKKGIIFKCLQAKNIERVMLEKKNGFLMSNIEEKEMVVDLAMEEKGRFGNLVLRWLKVKRGMDKNQVLRD